MNPTPDESIEIDAPMTRAEYTDEGDSAIERTEVDPGRTSDDHEGVADLTDAALTRAPSLESASGALSDWLNSGSGLKTELETGGTGRRGIIGEIAAGQTLYSKYRVLKKLGGGAMGDVWLVRHVTLKSEHALKVIVPNFARNALALMRFQREFEVMATLRHEHAVTIYDACIDDDGGYIDMEFVDGQTIGDVLNLARARSDRDLAHPLMPLDWIVRVLDQLTDVLQAAHDKGIVHRDLKPNNMMLLNGRKPGKEYLKVLDFGIAKIRDDPDGAAGRDLEASSNKTEGFIGTPSYGSPEQAQARDDIDGRADLYSVGIMLYEFVTGRLPFRGSPLQVMSQNASSPPPPFYEANPKLRSLPEVEHAIFRVLAKDPRHRPQTARELFDEFRDAVGAVLPPGSASPTPPTWDALPFYSPTLAAVGSVDPTAQVGDREPLLTLESTLAAPLKTEFPAGSSTDIGPVHADRPRSPRTLIATVVGVSLVALLAVGLVVWFLPMNTNLARSPEPAVKPQTLRFDEVWPDNFLAVGGSGRGIPWPDQVRQTPEDRYFNRFADGIYLPDGYTAEAATPLVGGWPAAIVRDGIRFLRIEGNKEWTMGAWDAEVEPGRTDVPAHPVKLRGFYLQETEVTNGQFEDYLDRKQGARPTDWERVYIDLNKKAGGRDEARKHPAVNLSRKQALSFARSLDADLPTEAQWEYAARSRGERWRYVWGSTPPPSRLKANIEAWDARTTAPSKSYPDDRTVQGVYDLLGNVQEFCRDAWGPYRKGVLPELNPCGVSNDPVTVRYAIRGANFNSLPDDCSLTHRNEPVSETEILENLGFRLVVECPEPRKPD